MASQAGAFVDGHFVRIITISGAMSIVAKIASLTMTTILKCWPMARNACRPTPTECHNGLPTVTVGCMCG